MEACFEAQSFSVDVKFKGGRPFLVVVYVSKGGKKKEVEIDLSVIASAILAYLAQSDED